MAIVVDATTAEAPLGPSPRAAIPVQFSSAVADAVSDAVDAVAGIDRTIAAMMALRVEAMNQAIVWSALGEPNPASHKAREMRLRSLRAEFACALRLPERTVEAQLVVAETLTHDLPATLAALKAGRIGYRHAQLMVDETITFDDTARQVLEEAALPFAERLTVAKFERKLRTLREHANPETMVTRHEKAVGDREVQYTPDRDGMAWLSAYLPAPVAVACYNRLTEMARHLKTGDTTTGETRTLTQLRADVFTDLLLDGEPTTGQRGIRAKVFVTVPVLSLLGKENIPASLDGYGPIDTETAKNLAGTATGFIRLMTHPETGAVLSFGTTRYKVPKHLREWLRVRDSTCRFPGCSRDASHCDIDHTYAWASGGETRPENLAHLCKGHHGLKHATGWQVGHKDGGGGILTWTSPTGRNYTTQPETHMRP